MQSITQRGSALLTRLFARAGWRAALLPALLLPLLLALYLLSGERDASASSLRMRASLDAFAKAEPGKESEARFEEIERVLEKHPQWLPFYRGEIAQIWLAKREPARALQWFSEELKASPYKDYAEASLLADRGELEAALEESSALQEQIDGSSEMPFLNLFNLWRIASLQEALGKKDEAEKARKRLLSLEKSLPKRTLEAFYGHLRQGEMTLREQLAL